MSTEFSIVTIVKHRTQQLTQLINSIERSSLLPKEMVIVWMASPSEESLLSSEYFNIRHRFATGGDLPIAQACNRGFDACTTENIIYLDVDCICPESLLEDLANSVSDGLVVTTHINQLSYKTEELGETQLNALTTPKAFAAEKLPFIHFQSTIFGITRNDYQRVGGLDTDYHGYGIVDLDFAMRCCQAGLVLFNIGRHVHKQFHVHFDPPVNHICDIVANAETFKQKWNCYPFCDWLERFADLGFVNTDFEQTGMRVTRLVREEELSEFLIEQPSVKPTEQSFELQALA